MLHCAGSDWTDVRRRLGVIAIPASLLTSCGRGEADDQVDTLVLNGPIDESAYRAFNDFRKRTPIRPLNVLVRSTGGDARWGLKLGDAMLAADVRLTVRGICHSACAQYVLPSASSAIIEPGASVGFHSAPSDLQLPADAPAEARIALAQFIDQETAFYSRRKIDARLMSTLRAQRLPICQIAKVRSADLSGYGVASRFVAVVPSTAVLRHVGYSVSGYWPANGSAAVRDARLAGFDHRPTIRYVNDLPISAPPQALPPCPFLDS